MELAVEDFCSASFGVYHGNLHRSSIFIESAFRRYYPPVSAICLYLFNSTLFTNYLLQCIYSFFIPSDSSVFIFILTSYGLG